MPLRVLHVDTGKSWRGGQQQAFWLMEGLRERGVDQKLLAPTGSPLAIRARAAGLDVAELSTSNLTFGNLRTVCANAAHFDLLHAHDAHAHTLAWAAGRFRPGPVLVVSRRVVFPVRALGRWKNRFPAVFIAVSDYVRRELIASGVADERIRVIFDGVEIPAPAPSPPKMPEFRGDDVLKFRGDAEAGPSSFVIGTLTSLATEKTPERLIDLLAALPETAQLWVGVATAQDAEGPAARELAGEARHRGVAGRFRIVSLEDGPRDFLCALNLFVYLSRAEGLGSAILLAMGHSLPVVASRVGGIPEIVWEGETGLLVDPGQPDGLPEAVIRMMDSPDLRQRFGTAGRDFILTHATSDRMVARTMDLYEEFVRRSNRAHA